MRLRFSACSASNPVSTTMVRSGADYRPDEIVQGHGAVVGIAAQEVVAGGALEVRVADSDDLVVDAHGDAYLTKDRLYGLFCGFSVPLAACRKGASVGYYCGYCLRRLGP